MAEVLITLAVIGVVAALTIPTLNSQIQKAVLKNQFKKMYSMLTQAVLAIQTEEGRPLSCYYWDGRPDTICKSVCTSQNEYGTCQSWSCEDGTQLPSNYNGYSSDCEWFYEELFLKRLKTSRICKDNAYNGGCLPKDFRGIDKVKGELYPNIEQDPDTLFSDSNVKNLNPVYVLSDGSYIIGYYRYLEGLPVFAIDINGQKGPNKWGYDIFQFILVGNPKAGIRLMEGRDYLTEQGGVDFDTMYKEAFGIK